MALYFSVLLCIIITVFLAWLFASLGAVVYVIFRKLWKDG